MALSLTGRSRSQYRDWISLRLCGSRKTVSPPFQNCFVAPRRIEKAGARLLERDPEKWDRFSLATNAGGVCAEIMLRQEEDDGHDSAQLNHALVKRVAFSRRRFTDHTRLKCLAGRSHPVEVSNIEFNGDGEPKAYVCCVITTGTG
jgi:hypothetical protein